MRTLTWNLEWKSPRGRRPVNRSIREEIDRLDADVVCLTETQSGWLAGGHEASSLPGLQRPKRRKIVIWSRWPITDADPDGPDAVADLRRWCAVTVHTPSGPMRILGIVIPYAHSNVTYGSGVARPWEDHARYLDALEAVLATRDKALPTVVLGDFNQRLDGGPTRTPVRLQARLREAFHDFEVVTKDLTAPEGYLLDHIAVERPTACRVSLVPRKDGRLRRSDHHGAWMDAAVSAGGPAASNPKNARQ